MPFGVGRCTAMNKRKPPSPEHEKTRVALSWLVSRMRKLRVWGDRIDDVDVLITYGLNVRGGRKKTRCDVYPFTRVVKVSVGVDPAEAIMPILECLAHCACEPHRERHDLEWKDFFATAAHELTGASVYTWQPVQPLRDAVERLTIPWANAEISRERGE